MKQCRLCGEEKPLSEYTKHKATRDGLRHECRACRKKQHDVYVSDPDVYKKKQKVASEYRERETEKIKEYRKKKYSKDVNSIEGRAYSLFVHARGRASLKSIQFDLDYEWVLDRLKGGVCEATGIPFVFDHRDNGFSIVDRGMLRNPFTPSIDKTDPNKGYTKDNCKVVVYMYNTCKNAFSDEAVQYFCSAYVENINGVIDGRTYLVFVAMANKGLERH